MGPLLRWYKRLVDTHPYRTQMITAGILSTSGDLIAQTITKSTVQHLLIRKEH